MSSSLGHHLRAATSAALLSAAACDAFTGTDGQPRLSVRVTQPTVNAERFEAGDTLFTGANFVVATHAGVRVRTTLLLTNPDEESMQVTGCPRYQLLSTEHGPAADNNCAAALPSILYVPPNDTMYVNVDFVACTGDPLPPFSSFCFERLTLAAVAGEFVWNVAYSRARELQLLYAESDPFDIVDPGAALVRAP
jgi:hypothetical protein